MAEAPTAADDAPQRMYACADGPIAGQVISLGGVTGGIIQGFTYDVGKYHGSYRLEKRDREWAYYWTPRA